MKLSSIGNSRRSSRTLTTRHYCLRGFASPEALKAPWRPDHWTCLCWLRERSRLWKCSRSVIRWLSWRGTSQMCPSQVMVRGRRLERGRYPRRRWHSWWCLCQTGCRSHLCCHLRRSHCRTRYRRWLPLTSFEYCQSNKIVNPVHTMIN